MPVTPRICRAVRSDIAECQWLLKLHTFGLLNNSFQPSDAVRAVRTLRRHRGGLVAQPSSAIQRMQKALIEMNLHLSSVLSDLSGVSGMAILQAILARISHTGLVDLLGAP
jgi:transposase